MTFRHPFRRDMLLVKRLVGLPGERVTVVDGRVHVDGVVLAEPWADGATSPVMELPTEPDHVVVLSDNRSVTLADSRTFGAIPVTALEHKVIARYWPPGSIGRI